VEQAREGFFLLELFVRRWIFVREFAVKIVMMFAF
jgi:hypothetical protein